MSKGRQNLILLLLTAYTCIVVEGASRHVLEPRGDALPFMFRWERSAEIDGAQRIGFDRAHPLWGWNMSGDFGYVTVYENDLYRRLISSYSESPIMPNAVALLRLALGLDRRLSMPPLDAPGTFLRFRQNLLLMQAAAEAFGHTHIGVLQPLKGLGANDPVSSYKRQRHWLEVYQAYYPEMRGFVAGHDGTLFDFTDLFDGVTSPVYVDDCHILPEHQPLIALRLFNILDRTDAISGLMMRSRSDAARWR